MRPVYRRRRDDILADVIAGLDGTRPARSV
jgi:hypothetical protein